MRRKVVARVTSLLGNKSSEDHIDQVDKSDKPHENIEIQPYHEEKSLINEREEIPMNGEKEHDEDQKTYGGLGGFEPDVINYADDDTSKNTKDSSESGQKTGFIQKVKNLPMWAKIAIAIVIASAYMIFQDIRRNQKPAASAEVEITQEMNTSKAPEVETQPVPEQSPEQIKMEKLNSCLIASPLSFKFGQEGIIPMFGAQNISNEATFCDEFSLKNYHLDGANNSLSIVGDIYSGATLIKHTSVDPLAYFKPSYFLEGISIKHPVTQAEVIYMPGDFLLKSPSASLQLTGVTDKGTAVEFSLLFNGQKTAITIDRKYVQ